jgi:Zn-dependent protease
MQLTEKNQTEIYAYWFAAFILIAVLGSYGMQVIEWVLMKLYEFFIQKTPVKL